MALEAHITNEQTAATHVDSYLWRKCVCAIFFVRAPACLYWWSPVMPNLPVLSQEAAGLTEGLEWGSCEQVCSITADALSLICWLSSTHLSTDR